MRWLEPDEAPLAAGSEQAWSVAQFGFVHLERAQPGIARVAIEGALDVRLVLEMTLQRGSNARKVDLPSARVELSGFASGPGLWLVCDAPGLIGLRPIDGDARSLRVPAGRVRAVRFAAGEVPGPAGGETLSEVQLAPGATAELRLDGSQR